MTKEYFLETFSTLLYSNTEPPSLMQRHKCKEDIFIILAIFVWNITHPHTHVLRVLQQYKNPNESFILIHILTLKNCFFSRISSGLEFITSNINYTAIHYFD